MLKVIVVNAMLVVPDLLNVYLFRILVDFVIARSNVRLLPYVMLGYISVYLCNIILQALRLSFVNKLNYCIKMSIRKKVFNKILHMNYNKFCNCKISDLKQNVYEDMDFLQEFISSQFIDYTLYYVKVLIYFIALLNLNVILTLVMTLIVPIFLALTKRIRHLSTKVAEEVRINNIEYDNWLFTSLNGWKEIKTYSFLERENENFEVHWDRKKQASVKESFIWYCNRTVLSIKDFLISNVLLYALGGVLIVERYLAIGQMLVFVEYFQKFINFINEICNLQLNMNTSLPILERIFAILDEEENGKNILNKEEEVNTFVLKNVSFYYTEQRGYVLKDANLSLKKCDKVLIAGKSGIGKSTLIKLMLNLYKPQHGSIELNGVEINKLPQKKYHKLIGAYLQDSFIFNMSIYDNLAMAKDCADISDIINACKLTNIHEYIISLPDGYNTIIEENGTNFSRGQIQRIAVARLILQDPQIIILDEATISLDCENEKIIMGLIKSSFMNKIVIIVSHKKEHIEYADKYVTFNEGQIKVT